MEKMRQIFKKILFAGTALIAGLCMSNTGSKAVSAAENTETLHLTWSIAQADGSVTASDQSTTFPNNKVLEYTKAGDGSVTESTVSSSNTNVASIQSVVDGVITVKPNNAGTCNITIGKTAGTNYTAAAKTIKFTVGNGTIMMSGTDPSYDKTVTYTGSDISPNSVSVISPASGYTITYSTELNGVYTTDKPVWRDAGTYTVYYRVAASNYTTKTGSYTLTIDRAGIVLPAAMTNLTYNGNEQTGVNSGNGYTITGNKGTNAGSYIAKATPDSNHKWSDNDDAGERSIVWSIARKGITVPAANAGLIYDGTEKTGVNEDDEHYTITGHKATNAGNGYKAIVTPTLNYQWDSGSDTTGSREIMWSIAPASIEYSVLNNEAVYSGEEISPNSVSVTKPVTCVLKYGTVEGIYDRDSVPVFVNAGEHIIYFKIIAANYTTVESSYTLTITRKPVAVPEKTDYVYDGEEHTGVSVGTGYTLTGTVKATDADTYTVTATPGSNYQWDANTDTTGSRTITWTISRKPVARPVVADGLVYNEEEQTGVSTGEGYILDGTSKAVNAGNYSVTAKIGANYQWNDENAPASDMNINWSIARKPVLRPVVVENIVYDGFEHTAASSGEGYSLTGDIKGIDAGSYNAKAVIGSNYQWNSGENATSDMDITWYIGRKPVSRPSLLSNLVYNGKEQSVITEGEGYSITGRSSATNAGDYSCTAVISPNHQWKDGKNITDNILINWSIARKPVDRPEIENDLIYNGEEQTGVHTGEGYTLTGTVKATNADDYSATAIIGSDYKWNSGEDVTSNTDISWSIGRKSVAVPIAMTGLVYNGKIQTGVPAGTGYTITGNTNTESGTHTAVASVTSNYKWNDDTVTNKSIEWSMAKADPALTAEDQSVTYPDTLTVVYSTNSDGNISADSDDEGIATILSENRLIKVVPVSAGNAEITISQAEGTNYNAAEVKFTLTVNRAASSVSAIDDILLTFPGTGTRTVEKTGNGDISVISSKPNLVSVALNGNAITLTPLKNGTSRITVSQSQTGQYRGSFTTFNATVEGASLDVSAVGYNKTYTGDLQVPGKVTVDAEAGTYTIYYRDENDNPDWSEEVPQYINAGTYEVFYKVVSPGYNDETGSFTGNIKKADSVLTLPAVYETYYDGYNHAFTFESKGAGDINLTLSGNRIATILPQFQGGNEDINGGVINITDITGAGDIYVTLAMDGTHNWNEVKATTRVRVYEKKYRISFDTDGGTVISPRNLVYGTKFTLPDVSRTGYTFNGWYDGETLVSGNMTATIDVPAADTVYTAHWTGNDYTVFFNPNGGSGSISYQERVYGDGQKLPPVSLTKPGYIFAYWSTEADGSGKKFADGSGKEVSDKDDVTLYAQWIKNASPEDADTYDKDYRYRIGDAIYKDGSLYICIKDIDDDYSDDKFDEYWAKIIINEDITVPAGSSVITVSENGLPRTTFNRGDYIFVRNDDGTIDIYVCIKDNTDGSYGLDPECWKKVTQVSGTSVYNTTVIYNIGDMIYKDGEILVCIKDGTTGIFNPDDWQATSIVVKEINIIAEEDRIRKTSTTDLDAIILPENATDKSVTWQSLDPDVATIDTEGLVTAVSVGTADLCAVSSSGKMDHMEMEVFQGLDALGMYDESLAIREGEEKGLIAIFEPADAEHGDVIWTVDKPENLSVDDNGRIKGLKRGTTATVTATCEEHSAECRVTVLDPCKVSVSPKEVKLYLNGTDTCMLAPVIEPKDAGIIKWTSEDPGIASVDENGVVTAHTTGETYITGDCLGITDVCHVTVGESYLKSLTFDTDYVETTVGDRKLLTISVSPANAGHGEFIWTSEDDYSLEVYPCEGGLSANVLATRMGSYKVSVTEKDTGITATATVRGIELYGFNPDGSLVTTSGGYSIKKEGKDIYCFDPSGRAAVGFIEVNNNMYYFDPDTGKALYGIQKIKGNTYYFDKSGIMARNNKVIISGAAYYFGLDGVSTGGVFYIPDKKDTKEWYYFDKDGVAQTGVFAADLSDTNMVAAAKLTLSATGSDEAKLYYFKNGKLTKPKKDGFISVEGDRYYVYTDGHTHTGDLKVTDKKGNVSDYMFNEDDGKMVVGATLSEGRLIPLDKDGKLIQSVKKPGLTKIGGGFYWFEVSGSDISVLTGWKDVLDAKGNVKAAYYFDPETGASTSGIRVIDGVTYVFQKGACVRKDSVVTVNRKKYVVKVDGRGYKGCATMQFGFAEINGKSYYTDEERGIIQSGILSISGNVFYTDKSGAFQTDKWVKINKNRYHTDAKGAVQSGRITVRGKTYYMDPRSRPAGMMKTGLVKEGDDIFLYGANGILMTGNRFVTFKGRKYFVNDSGKIIGTEEGSITVPDPQKGNIVYELDKDGALLNGTKLMNGKLYLYKDGIQVLSKPKPAKGGIGVWKTVNKRKYLMMFSDDALSANVCCTGYYTDPKGREFLLKEDGAMAAGELIEIPDSEVMEKMTPDADGRYWYYYNTKGQKVTFSMTRGGWYKVGKKLAHIYESGSADSGWMEISGHTYWFDPDTGLTNINTSFVNKLL